MREVVDAHRPRHARDHEGPSGYGLVVAPNAAHGRRRSEQHAHQQHQVPEPHREPEPDPGLERLAVDPAGLVGPVLGENGLDLHPTEQPPESEPGEVRLTRFYGRFDAGERVLIVLPVRGKTPRFAHPASVPRYDGPRPFTRRPPREVQRRPAVHNRIAWSASPRPPPP